MKRWLVIFIAIVLFFPAGHVQAQEQVPEIDKMDIEILPEYDRPDVLVIYHISLGSNASLPASMIVRIPAAAGKPYNVAVKDVDGQLYNQEYSLANEGDWLAISLDTPLPELQIEYYDPQLVRQDGHREFTYTWPQNLVVNDLSIEVYQPIHATNMKMKPEMGTGRTNAANITQYSLILGTMQSDYAFQLELSYDKADDTLSSPAQPVQPSAPITEKTAGWVTLQEVLPWLLGGLGLLLIGGGAFWYWRSGRQFSPASFRRRHESSSAEANTQPVEGGVFCHKCGRRASQGDVFCRTCGTKLRLE